MNGNFEEKKISAEQIPNEDKLAGVAGGLAGEGFTINASFVCPLCGKGHRFRIAMTGTWGHAEPVNDGSPCEKIDHLNRIVSIDFKTKAGILDLQLTDGGWTTTVFWITGV